MAKVSCHGDCHFSNENLLIGKIKERDIGHMKTYLLEKSRNSLLIMDILGCNSQRSVQTTQSSNEYQPKHFFESMKIVIPDNIRIHTIHQKCCCIGQKLFFMTMG